MHLTKPKFYKIKVKYIPHDNPTNEWLEPHFKLIVWRHEIEENIFSFMACNISCANTQFPPLAPQAHPTDGCLTLCIWKKCSRFQMIQFSSRHKSGTHHQLSFFKMIKVISLDISSHNLRFVDWNLNHYQKGVTWILMGKYLRVQN